MQVQDAEERSAPAPSNELRIPEGSSSIDLREKGLQSVPAQVWVSAAALQRLNLSSNEIQAVPAERLAACTALQVRQHFPLCAPHPIVRKFVQLIPSGKSARLIHEMSQVAHFTVNGKY